MTIPNRIVMAPMTRSQSPGGVATDAVAGREGMATIIQLQRNVDRGVDRQGLGRFVAVAMGQIEDAVADAGGGTIGGHIRQAHGQMGLRLVGR